jgi:hypothetical protein
MLLPFIVIFSGPLPFEPDLCHTIPVLGEDGCRRVIITGLFIAVASFFIEAAGVTTP